MQRVAIALVVVLAVSCGGRTLMDDYAVAGAPGSGGTATGGTVATGGFMTTTGGYPSTGGASAGGVAGSAGDACLGLDAIADGSDGLIDDLEDGDNLTRFADHRTGAWWTASGDGCLVTPVPGLAALPVPPSANNGSLYAMQVTGSSCAPSSWGFQAGLILNLVDVSACAYDAAVYDGVQFWAIGQGVQLQTQVAERGTIPAIYGGDGTCDGHRGDTVGCWDNYAVMFGLSGQWALYSFSWSSLAQAGWGTQVPFDPSQISEVIFQISPDQAMGRTATFAIDDVRFYRGTPDPTPPEPGLP